MHAWMDAWAGDMLVLSHGFLGLEYSGEDGEESHACLQDRRDVN